MLRCGRLEVVHDRSGAVSQTDVRCRNDPSTRHRRPHPHRARRAGLDAGSVGRAGRRVAQRRGTMGDRPRRPGHHQPDARRRGTGRGRRTPDVRARQDSRLARVQRGDELAMLRLYRECTPEDRQLLLRTARRLARASERRNRRQPRRAAATSEAIAQEASRAISVVGPAGQDDRHACAQHDAGGIRARQERQALGQHVAGLEVRHDQHVGPAGDRRDDVLDRRPPRD